MANYEAVYPAGVPVPYKTILEANGHLIENPPEEHDALIATLSIHPFIMRPVTSPHQLRLYKGNWINQFFLRGALAMQQHFKSRPTDIFLASYPKSGTTWLKAMIFATMTRTSYPLDQHPLCTHNPHQCISSMEKEFSIGNSQIIEAIPSPRVMNTHLQYSVLPESITNPDCRIIYVWRDPKDVLVSEWYFVKKIYMDVDEKATFDQFYELFCQGVGPFGSIWNHVLGYWKESKLRPEKILFLKYKHILQEPVKYAKKLAHFVGCPYSKAEENQGVIEQIVELCSFKKLKELDVNKGGESVTNDVHISYADFFRKGEVGDWKNHMTTEMAERLDAITKEKFKGSGIEI